MKKLKFSLVGIEPMTKEEMKKISGGVVNCHLDCACGNNGDCTIRTFFLGCDVCDGGDAGIDCDGIGTTCEEVCNNTTQCG